jgi:hypothetical protein
VVTHTAEGGAASASGFSGSSSSSVDTDGEDEPAVDDGEQADKAALGCESNAAASGGLENTDERSATASAATNTSTNTSSSSITISYAEEPADNQANVNIGVDMDPEIERRVNNGSGPTAAPEEQEAVRSSTGRAVALQQHGGDSAGNSGPIQPHGVNQRPIMESASTGSQALAAQDVQHEGDSPIIDF